MLFILYFIWCMCSVYMAFECIDNYIIASSMCKPRWYDTVFAIVLSLACVVAAPVVLSVFFIIRK